MVNGSASVSPEVLSNPVGTSVLLKITLMDKNIDQLLIKVSGKMFLGKKLELGQDVTLALTGSIVREEVNDNQDGSVNVCYVFKATQAELDFGHFCSLQK
jgi:hypothetical protein